EFRDRRSHLAFLVVDEVREPFRAPLLRELLEPLELESRKRLRWCQEAHRLGVREHAELRAAGDLGRIDDLEPVAEIRLVGAVAEHRYVVANAPERRLE